jgi:hypothetical protein
MKSGVTVFAAVVATQTVDAFHASSFCSDRSNSIRQWNNLADDDTSVRIEDQSVEKGSKKYLEGLLSSPIQDETVVERGDGLEQALKLSAGVSIALIVLVVGFLVSNDLI